MTSELRELTAVRIEATADVRTFSYGLMSRRSRIDRESERDAYRIMMPVLFWGLAFGFWKGLSGFFESVPWGRYYVGGVVFVLIVLGVCQIPRAIRTIKEL